MNNEITKFKLKKGQVEIHYRQEQGELIKEHVTTMFCVPHMDLYKAMDKLKVHLCLITEMVEVFNLPYLKEKTISTAFQEEEFYDDFSFFKFKCTGFTLSSEGVVLTGNKTLGTKKVLNMVTPFTLLNADSDYDYAGELDVHIDDVVNEVQLLLNGKVGNEQLDLFEQENAA